MSLAHKDRISELDSLKALALVMMLVSNFVSDLSFFKIMEVTKGFFAVDYFPLNPWLGLFFLSMASARFIYPDGKSLSNIVWPEKWIWLGRNTLLIYVFHQPFLIAIMLLTGIISFDQVLD